MRHNDPPDQAETTKVVRNIQSGSLAFEINGDASQLDTLLDFASRRNDRRGYLHVSRVLGKHIPARPSLMNEAHRQLASLVSPCGINVYVIGMAETATGLGAGVARNLCLDGCNVTYQHTTRFRVGESLVDITEAHSHASAMILAQPNKSSMSALREATDIVLVDDEISTGATMLDFVTKLLHIDGRLDVVRVHIVSLASWLDEQARSDIEAALPDGVELATASLMDGRFTFHVDPNAVARPLPADVDSGMSCLASPMESALASGIFGAQMPRDGFDASHYVAFGDVAAPIVVIGMGEFLDGPFQTALALEWQGFDVLYQSSTRSPIALGDCIESMIEFEATGKPGKKHYLYNPLTDRLPLVFDGFSGASASHLITALAAGAITDPALVS